MPLLPTYLMAFGALAFAALSALTIVYVLSHLDEPAPSAESPVVRESRPEHVAA